jgi:translation initiation factor 1 (eIF-1/SUI1)
MPELTALLVMKREQQHEERKFFAAIQGIDLDKNSTSNRGQKEWEDMKARVFSSGQAKDSSDIISLQGANASKAGFGIGAGIDYVTVKDNKSTKNPIRP